jgi:hypothetical protein
LFYPDHTTLRRYLVDEGLLTRAEGVYWRTGGRAEPPQPEEGAGRERDDGMPDSGVHE